MSGIYVHFPFCKRKCIYCNFYSVSREELKSRYLEALSHEIELRADELRGDTVETLYFGGGTPSLCTIDELVAVAQKLRSAFIFAPEPEFTVEANPEQLTTGYLRGLRKIGVNRLSIGVQSFDDEILAMLGRTHSAATAKAALENAFATGFDNVSIDLIYGIAARQPGQWRQELKEAFSHPITHLSAYSLTVEENTLLHRKIRNGALPPLNEDCAVDDYWTLIYEAGNHSFEQNDITNFARDGKISRHNSAYWAHTPYLGLGAAAHSFNG
ncbi:MAG: radical SAM family heme chaperone HemW, partial [Bacteroidales bacterium]|nr:radical SAM family heme chaperone HemW [Bacteroidales bacterium]